jgi:hypothetical protein
MMEGKTHLSRPSGTVTITLSICGPVLEDTSKVSNVFIILMLFSLLWKIIFYLGHGPCHIGVFL